MIHFSDELDIIGGIDQIELIATGKSIRDIKLLRKQFGPGRWRKLKESPLYVYLMVR